MRALATLLNRASRAAEAAAGAIALRRPGEGLSVEWSPEWSDEHDHALDGLTFLDESERHLHRLLGRPTSATKVHAIVSSRHDVVAVVTLRRRADLWEPASAQCLPGTPIACAPDELGRVLRGLGRVVDIGSLYTDPSELRPFTMRSYDRFGADLHGDYEAHWPRQGGQNYRTARKRTADFEVRVDHPGDLEWTVGRWVDFWADDASGQTASAPDRLAIWGELERDRVHTVVLATEGRPAAGCVHFCADGVVKFECTGRDVDFEKQRVGTRVLDASFEWAATAGYDIFDMGGGADYKKWWAPPYATSYAAQFVPMPVQRTWRVADSVRSALTRR